MEAHSEKPAGLKDISQWVGPPLELQYCSVLSARCCCAPSLLGLISNRSAVFTSDASDWGVSCLLRCTVATYEWSHSMILQNRPALALKSSLAENNKTENPIRFRPLPKFNLTHEGENVCDDQPEAKFNPFFSLACEYLKMLCEKAAARSCSRTRFSGSSLPYREGLLRDLLLGD